MDLYRKWTFPDDISWPPALEWPLASAFAPGAEAAAKGGFLSAIEFGIDPTSKRDQTRQLQTALSKAADRGGMLFLPAGRYLASGLRLEHALHLSGVPGATTFVAVKPGPILELADAPHVTLSGLAFDGAGLAGDDARSCLWSRRRAATGSRFHPAAFIDSEANGLVLVECAGRVVDSRFGAIGKTGLFALDLKGLEIAGKQRPRYRQ